VRIPPGPPEAYCLLVSEIIMLIIKVPNSMFLMGLTRFDGVISTLIGYSTYQSLKINQVNANDSEYRLVA